MALQQSHSVGIELRNIDLSYGNTRVIKDVSLKIRQGEFFAFLGPSGCGKSTLLRLIAGFEQCQKGEVYLGDEEVSNLPPWKREFLGNLVRYEIQVGQQNLIVDEVYGQGGKLAETGAKTGLRMDTRRIVVMD